MPCAHISDLNLRACRGLELGYDPTLGAKDGALCQSQRESEACYHKKRAAGLLPQEGLLGLFGSEWEGGSKDEAHNEPSPDLQLARDHSRVRRAPSSAAGDEAARTHSEAVGTHIANPFRRSTHGIFSTSLCSQNLALVPLSHPADSLVSVVTRWGGFVREQSGAWCENPP